MLILVLNGPALPPILWQATWSAEHTWIEEVAYLWPSTVPDAPYQITIDTLPPIIGQIDQLPPSELEAAIQEAAAAPPIDVTVYAGLPQAIGELPAAEIEAVSQEGFAQSPPADIPTLGWLPVASEGPVWDVEVANQEAVALAAPADVTTLGRPEAWWELPTGSQELDAGSQETLPPLIVSGPAPTFLTQVSGIVETAQLGQGTIRSKPLQTYASSASSGRPVTDLDYAAGRNFLIQTGSMASTAAAGKGGSIRSRQDTAPGQPADEFEDWLLLNDFDFVQAELDHEEHALAR